MSNEAPFQSAFDTAIEDFNAAVKGNVSPQRAAPSSRVRDYSAGQISLADENAKAPERSWFGAINDTVIDTANSTVGLVKSGVDLFAPDSDISKGLSDFIKMGEESQSDKKKFLRGDLERKLREAGQNDGSDMGKFSAEAKKAGVYLAHGLIDDPAGTVGQIVGNIGPFAALGNTMRAASLSTGAKEILTGGISAGLGMGEVRGNIWEKIANIGDSELQQKSPDYAELRKTMSEPDARREIGANIQRNFPELAAIGLVSALTGRYGVEGMAAGIAPNKGRIANAAIGFADEGLVQGGGEQLASNVGVQRAIPSQSLVEDIGTNVVAEGLPGIAMGLAHGGGNAHVPLPDKQPNPMQNVIDQAQKPGSVLSRAVVSTGVTEQPQPQAGVDQTQSGYDPISARAAAVDADLRANGTLEKIRGFGPETSDEFLYALGIARNPNLDPGIREKAITQVEQVLATANSGTGFVMQPSKPKEPGTEVALRENNGGALATNDMNGQFFDPNTIDGEAVRVDNMLPGPRALPAPGAAAAQQPTESVAQNQQPASFAPAEQQNVSAPNTIVAAQKTADQAGVAGMAEVQAPRVEMPAGSGPAVLRKRKAMVQQLAENGFETVQREGKDFWMVNSKTGQKFKLEGAADAQLARKAINDRIDALAHTAAASPKNDLKEPTKAQIDAGNYKKSDVINLNGMQIKIENPQGSVRRGVGPDGKAWETKMAHHYGEFQGTVGADGDKLDVFLGPRKDTDKVYVIDQVNQDGSFDEHKVMMGFTSEGDARQGYLANYDKGWTGLGAITEMSVDDFKAWAKSRAAKKPLSAAVAAGKAENFTAAEKAEESQIGEFFNIKDNGKQKQVKKVKKAALPKKSSVRRVGDSVLRKLSQDDATMIEQIAAILGKNVVFFDAGDTRVSDGFVMPGAPNTLFVATETTVNPLAVFGHEFYHTLRETNPEAWNAIAKVVRGRVKDAKGFRNDYYGEDVAEAKGDQALGEEQNGELEELISDLGGNLMLDQIFWKDVFNQIQKDNGGDAKGIIARLAATIEQMLNKVLAALGQPGYAANDFIKDGKAVRNAFSKALAEHIKAAGETADIKKSTDRPAGLTVEGYHYSKAPRQVLNSAMFGTGLKGSARNEIMENGDARLKQRISFYVDKGTGINPEAGVGGVAHKATLTNVYDSDADPLRLRSGNARDFESKVLDNGYSGYLTRLGGTQSGQVIMLGKQSIPVEKLASSKVTNAKVVPAPQQREQDTADRLMAVKGLPAGVLSPQQWSEVLMSAEPELAAQLLDVGAFAGTQGMYRDELASKVRSLTGQIKKSADRAKSEYAEVEAKYKGTDQWMKAPNGEATELSERQWVQVRTPSFKKWFGDWEKHARAENPVGSLWSDDNVSKAVGKNGEPLVVYHGSDKGGFTEFEKPSGRGRGDLGIWTTPDYGMAKSYVRKGRARDVDLTTPTQSELEEAGYEFIQEDDGITVVDPNAYNIDGPADNDFKFRSIEDAVAAVVDEFAGEPGAQPGVYALFINVRNPNESSFEGAMWNGERIDQYQVRDENDEPVYDEKGRGYFDRDTAEALVEANPGSELQPADPHYETTDDVVREAIRSKNDGAIIREVIDDGGGVGYFLDPQDIFVAFDPEQLKSADYNNGEFSEDTGDLRKSKDRLNRVDPYEMSTRIPTAKGKVVEDHVGDLLISDFAAGQKQEKWVNSVANLVTQYPNYREAASAKTPAQKLERLVRHMVDNLVWLHNQVPADTRQRSKLWYDGANRIAQRMSRKYELTQAQSSGILAVLSPQKDWFMNVSLGERVASIMAERQNFQWSKEMESTANRIYGAAKYQEDVDAIRGKSLSDLDGDAYLQAMWLRTYDQAHNSSSFSIVSPEGDSLAIAKAKTGNPVKVAWGGNSTIAKAISIFDNGTADNISDQLGTKHKVRNFYNNILVPKSNNGHVTIDTHAVAAALLRPLSGNSLEVMQNFGGTSNAISGLQGTYALYEEAYRRAADELGLLPRELQSITWEAVRGMYVPTFKSQVKNVDAIDKIWSQFKKGRLSYDGAREWVLEAAGGIEPPSWLGRDPGAYVEDESSSEPGDLSDDGVSRGRAKDAVIRAVVDDSGAAEEGIRKSGDRAGRQDAGSAESRSLAESERAAPQEALKPLPGAPRIEGFTGPDPRLVAVAERYARENGIDLHRQAEYVEVDPERAERIAQAYAEMKHDPQNPRVQSAYKNLIKQTVAQYRALEAAGYKFWFMDMDRADNQEYASSPWNAMRDIRANKEMGVFPTADGFGSSEDFDPKNNPLLEDTGIKWPVGSLDGKLAPVLANDLFRAVHDAFGHGLEGSGFRARGEENAWQAHIRLFTGSAKAAITTETRGQNSWLNYGPYGEKNRVAKVEDTVFADQKTGLMPDWTWKEGLVGDMPDARTQYNQRIQALKDLISCLKK